MEDDESSGYGNLGRVGVATDEAFQRFEGIDTDVHFGSPPPHIGDVFIVGVACE